MATTQVQRRRGTTVQYGIGTANGFRGADGELTVDTTLHTVRVHDGVTVGGFPLVRQNTAITGGTKCKITYDSQGLVTAGENLTYGDLASAELSTHLVEKNQSVPSGISEGETSATKCKITFDTKGLVTAGANLTTSDLPDNIPQGKISGLTTDLAGKMPQINVVTPAATSSTIQLTDNALNQIDLTGSATLATPVVSNPNYLHQILVQLKKSNADYNVTLGASVYFGGSSAPDMSSAGYYNIYYEFDKNIGVSGAWVVGVIRKQTASVS